MPNDMSGAFIAFDEASKIDWKKLTVLPMPSDHKSDIFYFPKTGKLGKLPKKEEMTYTVTNVDLSKVAPESLNSQVIYDTMQYIMKRQHEVMFYGRRREERMPTRKAYEILKTPDDWIQKSVREMRSDRIVYCILGALMCKWGVQDMNMPSRGFMEDCRKVAAQIERRYPGFGRRDDKSVIAHWNDDPRRRFSEVRDILMLADV